MAATMELRLVSRTEKSIEIEFRNENETILNLLKQRLLRDEKVASATYIIGHRVLDKPRLFVEVKSGKPEQIVRNAAKEIRDEYDEFETLLLRGSG